MATTKRRGWLTKLVVIALLGGGGWAGYRYGLPYLHKKSPTERLTNQLWLERLPGDERDLVRGFVVLEHDSERVGVFSRASRWRARAEAFVWNLEDDNLHLRFPQTDHRFHMRVRTWQCKGEAPAPFDWCLEVDSDGRKLRYFSRDQWRLRADEASLEDGDSRAELKWLEPVLQTAVAAPEGQRVGAGAETAGAPAAAVEETADPNGP